MIKEDLKLPRVIKENIWNLSGGIKFEIGDNTILGSGSKMRRLGL